MKYKKQYAQELVAHMTKGLSFEAFAGDIGVSRSTLYNWLKACPDFKRAKGLGDEACRKWWESIGIAGMVGKIKGFNATVWIFNMKNRFQWRNTEELQVSGELNHEALLKYIEDR